MKNIRFIYIIIASLFLTSCFQDLDQDLPFDYPEQPTPPPIGADGQMFYLSLDDDELQDYQSLMEANVVGSPTFVEGKSGQAYAGAANSYLTFDIANIAAPLSSEMTFAFWYKVNNNPDRAGILVIGPPHEGQPANAQNNRTSGIRIFREGGELQRVKANIGNGQTDIWLDGGVNADIDSSESEWIYIALVLESDKATLYMDGEVVSTTNFSGISWQGCDIISIGSGAPRFNEWGHLSDQSLIDEVKFYNKALPASEIARIAAL